MEQSCTGIMFPQSAMLMTCVSYHATPTILVTFFLSVEQFLYQWRLEFTCPESSKTKSHCIVFGDDALADSPSWSLDDQPLRVVNKTEHLCTALSSDLQAKPHVSQGVKRVRGSFYGLTPTGISRRELSPLDKALMVVHDCCPFSDI